jgi:chromosome segregation ATPase
LDGVKSRLEENERRYNDVNGKYSSVNTQYEQMQQGLQKLGDLREKDFSTFRKVWQIPDHRILEEASTIMKYMNDPSLREQYDSGTQQRIQMLQQEQNLGSYTQQSQQLQREMHSLKMQQAMGDPEISRFEREYDKRMGAGEFRKEVNMIGSLAHHNGEYLEPQVSVRRAYERMSKLFGSLETPTAEAQAKPESRAKPLPNMGSGKTGSPVPKRPRTTDDLRKLAASLR